MTTRVSLRQATTPPGTTSTASRVPGSTVGPRLWGLVAALALTVGCGDRLEPSSGPLGSPSLVPSQPSASALAVVRPSPAATPGPSVQRTPTPSPTPPPPPKPTGVTWDEQVQVLMDGDEETGRITQTVSWQAPRTAGVTIRVYGVTRCTAMPADPSPGSSGPCLVTGTRLPDSLRTLLATVPASEGRATWSWTEQSGCSIGLHYPGETTYFAVVLAAYSTTGQSTFAIAEPGGWYMPEPDEVIC